MSPVAEPGSWNESPFIRKQVLSWEYWLSVLTLFVRLLVTGYSTGKAVLTGRPKERS